MKKILLPTDFSDISKNAIRYAIEMFGKNVYNKKTEFIIFHAHYVAATEPSYIGAAMYNEPVLMKKARTSLNEVCEALRKQYPDMIIREEFASGIVSEEIAESAKAVQADMIVMGSRGAGGLGRVLLGSVANEIAKSGACPVMIIPKGVQFQKPEKVVFATDFKQLDDMNMLNPLRDVVTAYKPELFLLHLYGEKKTPAEDKEKMNEKLKAYFDNENYKKLFLEDNDPVQGIADFVTGYKADILALVGQERTFFENLFHKSVTTKMISYAEIPLLILNLPKMETNKTSGTPFRETVKAQVTKWKGELEALNVQMNLGKADLADEVNERTKVAKAKLGQAKTKLHKAEDIAENRWHTFREEMTEAIKHIKKALVG